MSKKNKNKKVIKEKTTTNFFKLIFKNIFYQFFIFILFILALFILLLLVYKSVIPKYVKDVLFDHKLTDIYYDEKKERNFNYHFRVNDFIIINNNLDNKFKINDIKSKKNNIFVITIQNKNKTKKIEIDLDKNEITDNNEKINNFKYISNKPYHIPFYIEYIFIKENSTHFDEFKLNIDKIEESSTETNYIDFLKNFFNQNKKDSIEKLLKIKDNLINLLYFDRETYNIKLNYQGSKKIDNIKDLNENILFRGNLFFYNNEIFMNEYEIVNKNFKNNENFKNNKNNVNDIINKCSQFNLFLIITKTCINIYKFKDFKKIIKMISFYFPTVNNFINEIINIFIINNNIYTSKKIDINNNSVNKNDNRLLLLNYNVILWILHNSLDSFIRLLYNYYSGICYLHHEKLIYIKFEEKNNKKHFYNKI